MAPPVLGFNIGGIPDMVRHTENGYLVEEKTSEAIVEGLLWLKEKQVTHRCCRFNY